jgi:hypothetical protein
VLDDPVGFLELPAVYMSAYSRIEHRGERQTGRLQLLCEQLRDVLENLVPPSERKGGIRLPDQAALPATVAARGGRG